MSFSALSTAFRWDNCIESVLYSKGMTIFRTWWVWSYSYDIFLGPNTSVIALEKESSVFLKK